MTLSIRFHDNLDLERWFRLPKGHERRIHGHRHAGVRIVQEGPTLVHALDAHHDPPRTIRRRRPIARIVRPAHPLANVRRSTAAR